MSIVREVVVERTLQSAPAATYVTATAILGYLPAVISVMTAILVALQIYKAITEIRAAKRKLKIGAPTHGADLDQRRAHD